ncbi:MAG: hypothetical protein CMH54_13375 [Myxococcales bacterium]|nr:hypothetical protein [Myxococcales bacterium]
MTARYRLLRSIPCIIVLLSLIQGCGGSAVTPPDKECDSQNPCPGFTLCHLEVNRCTAPAALPDVVYIEIQPAPKIYPRLHMYSLSTAEMLAEPVIGVQLERPVLMRGRLYETNSIGQASSSLLPSTVSLLPESQSDRPLPRMLVRSLGGEGVDSDGFRIWLQPDQTYTMDVIPDKTELPPLRTTQVLGNEVEAIVEVEVPGINSLSPVLVELRDPNDVSLTGAAVVLHDSEGVRVSGMAYTDESGSALLHLNKDAISPLTVVVRDLNNAPGSSYEAELDIDPFVGGDAGVLTVPVDPPSLLQIIVRGEEPAKNVPIRGAFITVTRLTPGIQQVVHLTTDSEGVAFFDQLQPGLHIVTALPPPNQPFQVSTRAIWVQSNQEHTTQLTCQPRIQMNGVVYTSRGALLSGFRVRDLAPLNLSLPQPHRIDRGTVATTDEGGVYEFLVGTGQHQVIINSPDTSYPPEFRTLEISPEFPEALITLDVELPVPFLRVFELTDFDGTPLTGANVKLAWPDPDEPTGFSTQTGTSDAEGRVLFALPGMGNATESSEDSGAQAGFAP